MLSAVADDTISAWVNGRRVLHAKTGELQDQKETSAPVRLNKGINTILIKVCQKWLYWLAAVRLAEPDGRPLVEGVTYGPAGSAGGEGARR